MKKVIALFSLMGCLYSIDVYASTCPSLIYKGAIDEKYDITLNVDNSIAFLDHKKELTDGTFTGSYVYDKYNKPLKISGSRKSEEEILLNEDTGKFYLRFINDSLVGNWTSGSGKTLPVKLSPISVPVDYESEIGLFKGVVNLVGGEFKSTIRIGDSNVELYSWDVADCMDNHLRGPLFSRKLVNDQNLYLIEWTIEYKPYGVLPANESILVHPKGDQIDLSAGSSGWRFGMYEYKKKDCSISIKDTHIEKICLKESMEPISDGEIYKLEEHKITTIYYVNRDGFKESEEKIAFRGLQGHPEGLFRQLENQAWQPLTKQ